MKLVVTIVQDKDSNRLSNAFIESDIRATNHQGSFQKTLRIRDAVGKRRQSDRSNEHVSD